MRCFDEVGRHFFSGKRVQFVERLRPHSLRRSQVCEFEVETPDDDDAMEIFRRFADGDADATYEVTVRICRYVSQVVISCAAYWRIASRHSVEDVLHDVLLNLLSSNKFRFLHEWSEVERFCSTTAYNKIVDLGRKADADQGRVNEMGSRAKDTLMAFQTPIVPPGIESVERNEVRAVVNEALSRLSDEHRQLLIWRYDELLSLESIAGKLSSNRETIRRRLKEAVTTFKELLITLGLNPDDLCIG